MTTAQIENPSLLIKPSAKLLAFMNKLAETKETHSAGENKSDVKARKPAVHKFLLTDEDRLFLNELSLETVCDTSAQQPFKQATYLPGDDLLNLDDIYRVHAEIDERNALVDRKEYLHELLDGSEVVLPKNTEIVRNPELEKRCKILKAQQQNVQYKAMTKNVDNVRQRYPEDTISYQMKQLNRHLIAVAQFIISVAAGFAFGFIGVELMVGNLDFGFRILLGIICALIIALAELYFLAKKLNEDLNFESSVQASNKKAKIN